MNLLEQEGRILGFRPEDFRPAEKGAVEEVVFPFRTEHVEYLGADRLVHGRLLGAFEGKTAVSRLPSYRPEPAPGVAADFAVARRDLRFFDAGTGARIGGETG